MQQNNKTRTIFGSIILLLHTIQLIIIFIFPMDYLSTTKNQLLDLDYSFPRIWKFDRNLQFAYVQYFIIGISISISLFWFYNKKAPVLIYVLGVIHSINILFPFLRILSITLNRQINPTIGFEFYFTIYFWIQWIISIFVLRKLIDISKSEGYFEDFVLMTISYGFLIIPYILDIFGIFSYLKFRILGSGSHVYHLEWYYLISSMFCYFSIKYLIDRKHLIKSFDFIDLMILNLCTNLLLIFAFISNELILAPHFYAVYFYRIVHQLRLSFLYVLIVSIKIPKIRGSDPMKEMNSQTNFVLPKN